MHNLVMTTCIAGGIALPLLLASCSSKAEDTVILDRETVLDSSGVMLSCEPPLLKHRRDSEILLDVDGKWAVAPPWKELRFANGPNVTLEIVAVGTGGQTFRSSVIGGAYGADGPRVCITFAPQIPRGIHIKELHISSSHPITCRRIVWREFDAL